jgi:hypothetical protein
MNTITPARPFYSSIKKYAWWIGSAVVLVPLVFFTTDSHLLPVLSYYGTSTVWTVIEKISKNL